MHCSLVPSTAWALLKPSIAAQPGSWIALVAIIVTDVAEVSAPGPLQDVAAERRHVPQLRTGGEFEAIRNHWIVALDVRIGRDIGHSGQRAQFQISAVEANGGPCIRQWIDVDEHARPHHVELHQVQQGGPAGERLNSGICKRIVCGCRSGQSLHGGRRVSRPLIGDGSHALQPFCSSAIAGAACLTAATMFG